MNNEIKEELLNLIEDTLQEVDELKKSQRFSASEISLGEDDSKIHGKDKNGSLNKEEDEDKKDEEKKDEDKKDDVEKGEGVNRQADPHGGEHKLVKSIEENNELIKSYVDDRFATLEKSMEALIGVVRDIADAPVERQSASYKDVAPLKKSIQEVEPMSKSQVTDELMTLKKSGTFVDSADFAKVELGSNTDLSTIINKYKLGVK